MKIRTVIYILSSLFAYSAHASLVVIGDVDAPSTNIRPLNYDLLENVRNGGTDIAWLTGGSDWNLNARYTDLRSKWTVAGATISDDVTTNIGISLSGRDLVVISQAFNQNTGFSAPARSAIANYLSGGGEVLFVAQNAGTQISDYNLFLSDIGSSMQFLAYGGSGTEVINTGTPYGQGVSAFELGGWTTISGGTSVVSVNGATGVAYEAIPEPSTLAFVGVFGGGLLLVRRRFRS